MLSAMLSKEAILRPKANTAECGDSLGFLQFSSGFLSKFESFAVSFYGFLEVWVAGGVVVG